MTLKSNNQNIKVINGKIYIVLIAFIFTKKAKLKQKPNDDLAINSGLLLNFNKMTLEQLFIDLDVGPEEVGEMMRGIHDWYQKEPHLPRGELHDQFIARLLIMRKFSIEKVKQKIDNYYAARLKAPEFLKNRDPADPNLNKYIKNGSWITLPQKTHEKHRISILRVTSNENVSVLDFIKVVFMTVDYRMWNDSVMGEHIILDYSNVTLPIVLQLTPALVSKVIYYFTECLGPKIKGIHIVNLPPYAETLLTLCKKLLKPKVVKRIHVYRTFDEVQRQFPKEIFPIDLGGTGDFTCQNIADAWEKTLCSTSWRNFFIEQDSVITDENKRINKKNFQNEFGLDGSFKKLNID